LINASVGSAVLASNMGNVHVFDSTFQNNANGVALAIITQSSGSVPCGLNVVLQRNTFLNNQNGAVLAAACESRFVTLDTPVNVTVCSCGSQFGMSDSIFSGNSMFQAPYIGITQSHLASAVHAVFFDQHGFSNLSSTIYSPYPSVAKPYAAPISPYMRDISNFTVTQFAVVALAAQLAYCSAEPPQVTSLRNAGRDSRSAAHRVLGMDAGDGPFLQMQDITMTCTDEDLCNAGRIVTFEMYGVTARLESWPVMSSVVVRNVQFVSMFRTLQSLYINTGGPMKIDLIRAVDSTTILASANDILVNSLSMTHPTLLFANSSFLRTAVGKLIIFFSTSVLSLH